MPDGRSRGPRTALPGAQRALAALRAGLLAAPDAALERGLVAVVLRLLFLRCAGAPSGPCGWSTLRARFTACFEDRGIPLFDPARHPVLAEVAVADDAVAAAMHALADVTQLGVAYESLLAAQPGRRRTGSHYTPAALTGPLVAATLRPLLAGGEAPDLRVCDPAMGCGAFLLAACDALATFDAHVPKDSIAARRAAAERLYGVDLDPLAVELARLSLWLHVGDASLPPTHFDAQLRHGDSLVGLGPPQIAALSWDATAEDPPASGAPDRLDPHTSAGVRPDPLDPLAPASGAPDRVDPRLRGDALLAAFFASARPAAREQARLALAHADLTALHARRTELHARGVHPFHWAHEFPSVFARGGFDVMLGNPPFFWGNRIGRCFGDAYRDWLQQLHPGAHGNSDLAAHFLRRAFALLRDGGCLGFITTNSISEAETRVTGLAHARARGGVVYEARRDRQWPGDASVRVAQVCLRRGPVPGPHLLDGRPVTAIGDDLRPLHTGGAPRRLPARAGQSFKGVDFGGTGFLLSASARAALLREAPDECAYIWPVLNASGFTTSPTLGPDVYIINFSGLTLAEAAAAAPRCLEIVTREVLPRRRIDRRGSRRERWWIYNEACPGLYRAIAGLPRVLVGPVVAKHLLFGFVAPRTVFTNALNVFAFAGPDALALLQSRVHELWALRHASSLRSDPRYNPTTCFDTFNSPPCTPRLISAGSDYDDYRTALMRRRGEGLTSLYNRFHDPSQDDPAIVRLRELHAGLDRAVLDAYGWNDLADVPCEFQREDARWRLRWPQAQIDEIYDRLLAANLTAPARSAGRGRTRGSPWSASDRGA